METKEDIENNLTEKKPPDIDYAPPVLRVRARTRI